MASNRTIVGVLGGTGFVGGHLVPALISEGYRVRVLTRRPHRHREMSTLAEVELVKCNVYDAQDLRRGLTGCFAVINLVGILNESHRYGFQLVHVALPSRLVEICKQLEIRHLLHMSALNADSGAPSKYLRSKGEGENKAHATAGGRLRVTSFRPSVIFGPGDSFLNRFAGLAKMAPGVLPLACARARFAPVYVGDVVEAMLKALVDPDLAGKRIELCGPREYTLKGLVERVAEWIHHPVRVIPLPEWASRLEARVLGVLPGKLFTLDNYRSMKIPSTCREQRPGRTPLEAIAPLYLGDATCQSRLQRYRRNV